MSETAAVKCECSLHPIDGGTNNEDGSRAKGAKRPDPRKCERPSVARQFIRWEDGSKTEPIEVCELHNTGRTYGGTLVSQRREQLPVSVEDTTAAMVGMGFSEKASRRAAEEAEQLWEKMRPYREMSDEEIQARVQARLDRLEAKAAVKIERTHIPEFWLHECEQCGGKIESRATGRPPRFCSTKCRVARHRALKKAESLLS